MRGQDDPEPPDPDEDTLWRLYAHAVDEYRFQVNLNWQRLQYFLGLDVAILGVGAGLLRLGGSRQPPPDNSLPALVFFAGVCLSLASWHLARRQHAYYRVARDTMIRIADRLGVAELGVSTTAGARGEARPWWTKVRTVNEAVLLSLAVLNGCGVVYAITN